MLDLDIHDWTLLAELTEGKTHRRKENRVEAEAGEDSWRGFRTANAG